MPSPSDDEETRAIWDGVAADWHVQVGRDGDANRQLNSDPVLWALAGPVEGLDVLDAGCGTGYLSAKLKARGARVRGVDFSKKMVEIARANAPGVDFRVDSCERLETVPGASVDLVVANYVLMDLPDLEGAVRAFHRVLRPGGTAVVVFSHPCFPASRSTQDMEKDEVHFHWAYPYFARSKQTDPPWGHFTSEFIWFHRPLSDYWKAFRAAGFDVVDFEEPHLTADRAHLAKNERQRWNCNRRPYSVAFKLRKDE